MIETTKNNIDILHISDSINRMINDYEMKLEAVIKEIKLLQLGEDSEKDQGFRKILREDRLITEAECYRTLIYRLTKELHAYSKSSIPTLVPNTLGECIGEEEERNYYVSGNSEIQWIDKPREKYNQMEDRNLIPTMKLAEAVLALCGLIMLRDTTWRRDNNWSPDWSDSNVGKHIICFYGDEVELTKCFSSQTVLAFRTEEIRDEFYDKWKTEIEIAKPLL
jgi:hypothetical protein